MSNRDDLHACSPSKASCMAHTSVSVCPFLGGSFLNSSESPSTMFMCLSNAMNLRATTITLLQSLSGRNSCQTPELASPAHDLPAINNGDTHACRVGRRGSHAVRCTSEAAPTDLTVVDELQQLRGACGGLHAGPGLSARWACCPVVSDLRSTSASLCSPRLVSRCEECGRSGQPSKST